MFDKVSFFLRKFRIEERTFFPILISSQLVLALLIAPTVAHGDQVTRLFLDRHLDSQRSAIAVSDDGSKVYVAYIKWVNIDKINSDVFFTVIVEGGHSYVEGVNISNMQGRVHQAIVAASSNYVYIAWDEQLNPQRQDDRSVFLRTSNDYGKTFGPTKEISTNNGTGIVGLKGFIASGNNVYVTIADDLAGGTFFRGSHDNANTFDAPIKVSDDINTSMQLAESKSLYLFATQSLQIYASYDGGKTFNSTAAFKGSSLYTGSIFADKERIYAAWAGYAGVVSNEPNVNIFLAKSLDSGKRFSEPVIVGNSTTNSAWDPHVAAYGNHVYVTWFTSHEYRDSQILFKASNDGGLTFGPAITVGNGGESSMLVHGLFANEDNVFIIWQAGSPQEVFLTQSSDSGQTLQPAIGLSTKQDSDSEDTSQSFGGATSNYGNTVYASWLEDSGNGDNAIMFARYPSEPLQVSNGEEEKANLGGKENEYALYLLPLMTVIIAIISGIAGYLLLRKLRHPAHSKNT